MDSWRYRLVLWTGRLTGDDNWVRQPAFRPPRRSHFTRDLIIQALPTTLGCMLLWHLQHRGACLKLTEVYSCFIDRVAQRWPPFVSWISVWH